MGTWLPVYRIAPQQRYVNIASQQERALKVVRTLMQETFGSPSIRFQSREHRDVAVIGGGIAGVTAAAAAALAGCRVWLFERESELLHLQAGNHTRWVHPNVHKWPEPGWTVEESSSPIMKWQAGSAGDIVRSLREQWDDLVLHDRLAGLHEISVCKGVQSVSCAAGSTTARARRVAVTWCDTEYHHAEFDAVVLAVGFGVERSFPGVPRVSYWRNDPFDQSLLARLDRNPVRRYLVSGCGDGGLIDTIRLSLRDFRHLRFVEELLPPAALHTEFYRELGEIRKQLLQLDPSVSVEEVFEKTLAADHQKALAEIDRRIRARRRADTLVTLHCDTPQPLTSRAALLHLFFMWRLMKMGVSVVRNADLQVTPTTHGYAVRFVSKAKHPDGQSGSLSEGFFDEVIIRHGAVPPPPSDFGLKKEDCRTAQEHNSEPPVKSRRADLAPQNPGSSEGPYEEMLRSARHWLVDSSGARALLDAIKSVEEKAGNKQRGPKDLGAAIDSASPQPGIRLIPLVGQTGAGKTFSVLSWLAGQDRDPKNSKHYFRAVMLDCSSTRGRAFEEGVGLLKEWLEGHRNESGVTVIFVDGLDLACKHRDNERRTRNWSPANLQGPDDVYSYYRQCLDTIVKICGAACRSAVLVVTIEEWSLELEKRANPAALKVENPYFDSVKAAECSTKTCVVEKEITLDSSERFLKLSDLEVHRPKVEAKLGAKRHEYYRWVSEIYELGEALKELSSAAGHLGYDQNAIERLVSRCVDLLRHEKTWAWIEVADEMLGSNSARKANTRSPGSGDLEGGMRTLLAALMRLSPHALSGCGSAFGNVISLFTLLDLPIGKSSDVSLRLYGVDLEGAALKSLLDFRKVSLTYCKLRNAVFPAGEEYANAGARAPELVWCCVSQNDEVAQALGSKQPCPCKDKPCGALACNDLQVLAPEGL